MLWAGPKVEADSSRPVRVRYNMFNASTSTWLYTAPVRMMLCRLNGVREEALELGVCGGDNGLIKSVTATPTWSARRSLALAPTSTVPPILSLSCLVARMMKSLLICVSEISSSCNEPVTALAD